MCKKNDPKVVSVEIIWSFFVFIDLGHDFFVKILSIKWQYHLFFFFDFDFDFDFFSVLTAITRLYSIVRSTPVSTSVKSMKFDTFCFEACMYTLVVAIEL